MRTDLTSRYKLLLKIRSLRARFFLADVHTDKYGKKYDEKNKLFTQFLQSLLRNVMKNLVTVPK